MPLQISLFLHGLVVLFLSLNFFSFKRPEVISVDIYTSPAKPKFIDRQHVGSKRSVGVGNDPVSDHHLITEEPVIIFEPPIKQRTEEARLNRYTGQAKLKVLIDTDGSIRDVKLLNSLKYGLDTRAIELVRQVKLSPAKVNGQPVAVVRDFTINFRATD